MQLPRARGLQHRGARATTGLHGAGPGGGAVRQGHGLRRVRVGCRLTFSGDTAEGRLAAAALDPVRVECDASPQGDELAASGNVAVGSTQALIALGLTSDGSVTVDETVPGGSHRYLAAGTSSVTATGAHVEADVVEQAAAPARSLHVEGGLSCGRHADG